MTTKLTRSMSIVSVLLLASLMLLILGCGGVQRTILDAPANQRYWHESGGFAVLHWDAVPDAEHYEIYYFRADCSQDNWCRAHSLGETPSTSAAIYIDMGLYSYRCDEGPTCSRGPFNRRLDLPPEDTAEMFHDFRVATCTSVGCSDVETIIPAQRLDSPDGSLPDSPRGFQAVKFDRREAFDDAQIIWETVHGASSYEVWVTSDPSSEFRLGLRVGSHGLTAWEDEGDVPAEAMLHVEPYDTPTNRGTFGEYITTSWKLRACTEAGCSPFTEVLTIN